MCSILTMCVFIVKCMYDDELLCYVKNYLSIYHIYLLCINFDNTFNNGSPRISLTMSFTNCNTVNNVKH